VSELPPLPCLCLIRILDQGTCQHMSQACRFEVSVVPHCLCVLIALTLCMQMGTWMMVRVEVMGMMRGMVRRSMRWTRMNGRSKKGTSDMLVGALLGAHLDTQWPIRGLCGSSQCMPGDSAATAFLSRLVGRN
jgi:hypothetical protein